jgi:preprotein translocase subunit YajC
MLNFPTFFLAEANSQPGMNPLVMMIPIFLLMYFMIIRPQRRQQKEHAERMKNLKSGDRVITAGGVHGIITNVKDRTVIIKIADNVRVELEKGSVASVTKKSDEPETPEVETSETAETKA